VEGYGGVTRFELVRRMVTGRRSNVIQVAWTVGLIVVPTALRWSVDRGGFGLPLMTYWPTVMLASILLDTPFAIATAILSAGVAQQVLGGGPWFSAASPDRLIIFAIFAISAASIIALGGALRQSINQLAELSDQQEQFNRQLRHRVRNILGIIQSLASRGPKAESPLDFFREFSLRLEGLANASDLLQIGAEAEGRLPLLIDNTIGQFTQRARIHSSGPPCLIPNDSCIPLIMAIHELCTNAIRHGSLSVDTGTVDLHWFIGPDGKTLYVLWSEHGGPRVKPPEREGIGTRLLMPQAGLDGVELNFEAHGVWCELRINGARAL
jgi:two-component sensor histidine kinase